MPFRTVSKIGSWMWFSAGSATKTSVPAATQRAISLLEGRRAHRQRDGLVGPAERVNEFHGIMLCGVHRELGSKFSCELELLVDDINGDDPATGDRRVLDSEMAEATDAEDSDEIRRPRSRDFHGLVRRHAGTGERCGVDRVDAVGHLRRIARLP